MSYQQTAKQIKELIDAATDLSHAAAGKYEDRHKFKWDGPEIDALKRLRAALKALGDHYDMGSMIHDESGISLAHHSGCECLVQFHRSTEGSKP